MRSFTQSLVVLVFSLLTLLAYTEELSPPYKAPLVNDYPLPKRATVPKTTLSSKSSSSAESTPQRHAKPTSGSKKPPVPLEYKSCFDRNRHSYTYSYDHGEYHFSGHGPGSKTGKSYNTKTSSTFKVSSTSQTSSSYKGHFTSKKSSTPKSSFTSKPTITSTTSSSSFLSSSSSSPNTTSITLSTNTTSTSSPTTSSTLPANTTVPDCEPELQLNGVSEYGFNKKGVACSVMIVSCSKFDVANTTAFSNFALVSSHHPPTTQSPFNGHGGPPFPSIFSLWYRN